MDTNRPVQVRCADASEVESRLENARSALRQRAYELYRLRGENPGCHSDDWAVAEREMAAAPLVCVVDEGDKVRVSACIPDADDYDMAVDVLPGEIVVEEERDGKAQRFTRIQLPEPVDAHSVTADLEGTKLELVLRKASGS